MMTMGVFLLLHGFLSLKDPFVLFLAVAHKALNQDMIEVDQMVLYFHKLLRAIIVLLKQLKVIFA